MNKKHGFTLIELLVVISVIAILVGVVIPRFKGMQDEANKTKAKAELKTLQAAIESWYMNQDPNAYPSNTDDICADYLNAAQPLIVANILYDPFRTAGAEYSYMLSSNGSYYVILSYGPDRQASIVGIDDDGLMDGDAGDDVFLTNGSGSFQ